MRAVVTWLSVVGIGIFLGGAAGGAIGWQIGSLKLRHHPDETVRAAYLAGESESEDVVPRAALTLLGGLSGCIVGLVPGTGLYARLHPQERINIGASGTATAPPRSSITLFD